MAIPFAAANPRRRPLLRRTRWIPNLSLSAYELFGCWVTWYDHAAVAYAFLMVGRPMSECGSFNAIAVAQTIFALTIAALSVAGRYRILGWVCGGRAVCICFYVAYMQLASGNLIARLILCARSLQRMAVSVAGGAFEEHDGVQSDGDVDIHLYRE
ncbi:hypothetical protein LTR56_011026 [Elasticomyces elasticus]|nr:hypothetical protein LTR56_011026 [Elasticomyces elasticus]KAK3654994.1 hypothetical protein LTR22_010461 [Elasticomyces elasticus]KAK4914039.1 hypothetical protein LTR49_017655 [Elasticomyces elasticus]